MLNAFWGTMIRHICTICYDPLGTYSKQAPEPGYTLVWYGIPLLQHACDTCSSVKRTPKRILLVGFGTGLLARRAILFTPKLWWSSLMNTPVWKGRPCHLGGWHWGRMTFPWWWQASFFWWWMLPHIQLQSGTCSLSTAESITTAEELFSYGCEELVHFACNA